jgi:hypothetical protein
MLKLLEIYSTGNNSWSLREILINPDHIIKCAPDSDTTRLNQQGELASLLGDIDKRVQFTRISQVGSMAVVVVGSLEQIEEKINQNKKLLKG